jgi:hypothetical protein
MEARMSKVNYIISDTNITVNFEGKTYIVSRKDKLSDDLISCLREKRYSEIPELVNKSIKIQKQSKGNFVVEDGRIMINGVPASEVLSKKIIDFSDNGLPFQPLLEFAKKLQNNPSFRAVNELYLFLEKNNHPITEDGNFIAYKKVTNDFKDIYTRKIDNSVGQVVKMPRNMVNEDCNVTCSYGLHVANWDYAHNHYGSIGDTMLEVEVNPEHVVSVPVDYANAKMRVCEYKVLAVVDQPHDEGVLLRVKDACLECEELPKVKGTDYCEKCKKDIEDFQEEEEEEDIDFVDDVHCEQCGDYLHIWEKIDGICDSCSEEQEEEEEEEEES